MSLYPPLFGVINRSGHVVVGGVATVTHAAVWRGGSTGSHSARTASRERSESIFGSAPFRSRDAVIEAPDSW